MKYTHLSPVQLSSLLTNKTVRYENTSSKSSVTVDAIRTFKIKGIERVGKHVETGDTFVTAIVQDVDDCGEEKYRNLYVDAIDVIV